MHAHRGMVWDISGTMWDNVGRCGTKWDISGTKVGHKWIHIVGQKVGRCGTVWDISGTKSGT